jgi:diphthine-ammonia ligase
MQMLRFYYSVDLSMAADALRGAFSEAFAELAEDNSSMRTDKIPFYNIVPVAGSGRSACTNDIMTCELLASNISSA